MLKYFDKSHLLVLVCALLVLTAGCTDTGPSGESAVEEPDTAEAGVDAGEDNGSNDSAAGTNGTENGTANDIDGTERTVEDEDDGDTVTSDADSEESDGSIDDGSGNADDVDESSDSDGLDESEDDGTADPDSGTDGPDPTGGEDANDSDGAEEPDDSNDTGSSEDESDGSDTEGSDGSDGSDDSGATSEPSAFLGSDPSPDVLHGFPGHAGTSNGSPDVSDSEGFEDELADRGVDVRSVEGGDETVAVEYATSAEDDWEPAIDEMGAVSTVFWGLADLGHDAGAVEATVTDGEGQTLYTYRIERAWLTEYLDSIEAIENGTATSPADPSEKYAETVWTTVDVEA